MKLKHYRYIMAACLILWMLLIFLFSAQDGSLSSSVSEGFAAKLFSIIYPKFNAMSQGEQLLLLESVMLPLRKLAHFTLYFILGLIASGLFITIKNCGILLKSAVSWLFCVLYAISDEIHQYFVPERACALKDVVIDSAGALLAVGVFTAAICFITPLKKYKKFE